jgi:hypothetical protein
MVACTDLRCSLGTSDGRSRHKDPLKTARQIKDKWLCHSHVLHVYGVIPSELNSRPLLNALLSKLGSEESTNMWAFRW